jgi:hypothetical protein
MSAREAFDLESAVRAWRRQALSVGAPPTVVDELEDHLREEFAACVRDGAAHETAWHGALAKLGDPVVLEREFAKVDRLGGADRLALTAILGVAILSGLVFVGVFAARPPRAVERPVLTLHTVAVTLGYLAGLLAAAAAAYATLRRWLARVPLPALEGSVLRVTRAASLAAASLVAGGFVLGAVWAREALGRAFTGDPREIGAIAVVVCCIAAAAASRRGGAPVALAIAIASGGFVTAAWFGANAYLNSFPLWPTVIGFGGLGACLALAAAALKVARRPAAAG